MTIVTPLDLLKSMPCFSELSSEVMDWFLDFVKEHSCAKGEIILIEGERCPGLFVVKSGSVKLYRSSREGEEQIVRVVRSGGCFECAPLFDKGPNPVSAAALEASSVYLVSASDFELLLNTYPEIALQIVPVLAMRLRSLLNMVEDFSFRPVTSRLAKLLLKQGEHERKVTAASKLLNQQHLACILGCSRQVLNSALRKLVRDGILKMEGRRIVILKPDILREIV